MAQYPIENVAHKTQYDHTYNQRQVRRGWHRRRSPEECSRHQSAKASTPAATISNSTSLITLPAHEGTSQFGLPAPPPMHAWSLPRCDVCCHGRAHLDVSAPQSHGRCRRHALRLSVQLFASGPIPEGAPSRST